MSSNNHSIRTGVDLCDPSRIKRAIERHGDRFLRYVFTEAEIAHCGKSANPYPSYAARFAAKEAVMKLIGEGIGKISFTEIEVLGGDTGRPSLALYGKAERFAQELGIFSIDISLTHEKGMAAAFAAALTSR